MCILRTLFSLGLALSLCLATACDKDRSPDIESNGQPSAPVVEATQSVAAEPQQHTIMRIEEPPVPDSMQAIAPEWVQELTRLQGLTRANSGAAGSWQDLGMAYEKAGIRLLAVACYEQAQLRDADNPKLWYRSGICHWRLGNFQKALHDLSRAQALEPGYAPCYYRKGIIEMDAGDFDAAWNSFSRGAVLDPEYLGCALGQARILLQRDMPQEALAILQPMDEKYPTDSKVNNLLVTALRQAGVPSEREHAPTQFLGDTPDPAWGDPWQQELSSVEVISFRATMRALLRDLGEAERALEMMRERRTLDPDDWSFVDLQAQALFQLKRLPEARELYQEFLKVEPNNLDARLMLAFYHEADGTSEQGLFWLDQVLRLDPNNRRAWAAKGRMLSAAQQYAASYPVLQKAHELDPESLDTLFWLLNTMSGLKLWKESMPFFRSYLDRDPENGNVWLDLARARVKLRAFKKAEEALERAVDLNVGRENVVERLRELIDRRHEVVREAVEQEDQ